MLISDQQQFPPITMTLEDMGSVVVRFLDVEDTKSFGDFYESIERAAYRFYCPHPLRRENAEKMTSAALSPGVVGLVAVNDKKQIVAYATYQWNVMDNSPSVFGICILKSYRGLGLGKMLMKRIVKIAKKYGPPIMSLTVQKANPCAVALYRKMGFEIRRKQMRAQVEEFPPELEFYMERQVREYIGSCS
jgi:ribosomal protein S18 acetylase RimI-like enzyme